MQKIKFYIKKCKIYLNKTFNYTHDLDLNILSQDLKKKTLKFHLIRKSSILLFHRETTIIYEINITVFFKFQPSAFFIIYFLEATRPVTGAGKLD